MVVHAVLPQFVVASAHRVYTTRLIRGVASSVEMLSGRRKKDYEAEASADALAAQVARAADESAVVASAGDPIAEEAVALA